MAAATTRMLDVRVGSGARVKSAATLTSLPQIAAVISDDICVTDRKAGDFRKWDEADVTSGAALSDAYVRKCIRAEQANLRATNRLQNLQFITSLA